MTGSRAAKAILIYLGLFATTYEHEPQRGTIWVTFPALQEWLEHKRAKTLRKIVHEDLIDQGYITVLGRTRAQGFIVTPSPAPELALPATPPQRGRVGLASLVHLDHLAEAASRARTEDWRLKADLMAMVGIARVLGNERGSVHITHQDLARLLERAQGRVGESMNALYDRSFIDWLHSGRQKEYAFLLDSKGNPRPEGRKTNRIILTPAGRALGDTSTTTADDRANRARANRLFPNTGPGAAIERQVQVKKISENQLKTIGAAYRDADIIINEGDYTSLTMREASALIAEIGGPQTDPHMQRLRARRLRERVQADRSKQQRTKPVAPEPTEEQKAQSKAAAEESLRSRGYKRYRDGQWRLKSPETVTKD